jgi:hypothetical protein
LANDQSTTRRVLGVDSLDSLLLRVDPCQRDRTFLSLDHVYLRPTMDVSVSSSSFVKPLNRPIHYTSIESIVVVVGHISS